MKRIALTAGVLAASLVGAMFSSAPAYADEACTGRIGAITIDDNVKVPKGATCVLAGTTVKGNVLVGDSAKLTTIGARIDGNIQSGGYLRVITKKKTVIDGDIQLEDGGTFLLKTARVGGNIQVEDNAGPSKVINNRVDGDIQVYDTTGGIKIARNVVGGNLQCAGNQPAPTGGHNRVDGDKEGQCARL